MNNVHKLDGLNFIDALNVCNNGNANVSKAIADSKLTFGKVFNHVSRNTRNPVLMMCKILRLGS